MSKFDTRLILSGENRRWSVESAFLWSNFLKSEHSKTFRYFIWIIRPVVSMMQRGRHFVLMFQDLRFLLQIIPSPKVDMTKHNLINPQPGQLFSLNLLKSEFRSNHLGQLEFLINCDIRNWKLMAETLQCQCQFYPGTSDLFVVFETML